MAQELDLSAFKGSEGAKVVEYPRMVSARLSTWIDAALDQVSFGEEVSYDIGVALHPEQGMVHVLGMWVKGAALGTMIGGQVVVSWQTMNEESVLQLVTEMIEQLRADRSRTLQESLRP